MEKLYIEQKIFKITDHYPILNENEEVVYYVDETFRFFLKHFTVSDASKNELFTIDQNFKLFLTEFEIDFANGDPIMINQKFEWFKHSFEIDTDIGTITIGGNVLKTDYSVELDGVLLGRITRKFWSLRDVYEIEVHQQDKRDLLIAILIVVDAVKDQEERASRSSSTE